jgi:NADH:ubiquinone oxidoreductase subunit 6 (subunit J)
MTYLINSIILFVLVSALVVIMSNRIERSVLALIMTFALAGLLFILIGVPFFGFIYLLVYTAAISILFLFVIMMLDIPQDPHRPLSPSALSGGLFVSLGLFSIFYSLVLPLNLFGPGLNDVKIERLVYHLE